MVQYRGGNRYSLSLFSSLHDFKSDTLAEAYSDLEKQGMLNPVGIAALTDIPYVKDQLIKEKYPMRKVPRLVKYATSNDGFIWSESDTISNDAIDGLYHTSHDIDHTPSFGNGGDFGGGGASGSWDSGSSSDSGSYDSGSSDSSSSWSD